MVYTFFRLLLRFLFRLIAHIEVNGLENLPKSGGFILVGNHLGRLDPFLVYTVIYRSDIILLVAEKYRKSFIWRWIVRNVDGIWVDRFNADFHALRAVLHRLKQGGVLAIAPEGTRSPTGALIEGRSGATYLAAKSGLLVVPVAATGTEDRVVKQRLRRLQRLHIRTEIGQPFTLPPLPTRNREAALQQGTDEIMCRIAALLPDKYRGAYHDHPRLQELLNEPALAVETGVLTRAGGEF